MYTVKDISRKELSLEFQQYCEQWTNSGEYNSMVYDIFENKSLDIKELKKHINVVSDTKSGYGEEAFRYLWLSLVNEMPDNFKFLEIGVYKGSVLSLVEIITQCMAIPKKIYGVSPLNASGDQYSSYENDDYMVAIKSLFKNLEVSMDDTELIVGYSTDLTIKNQLKSMEKFDLIYIDGSHDYIDVVSDIDLANECLRPGGFLVLDDASSRINLGASPKFWGHEDVAQAIDDKLVDNVDYKHLMALGHNRVFKKI
jgi:hypothetical protein